MKAVLFAALVLGLASETLALAPVKKEVPKSLSEEVIQAWEKAGANRGYITESNSFFFDDRPKPGSIPGFFLEKWEPGLLAKLPAPEVPFGLAFGCMANITDAGLAELGHFKNLTKLELANVNEVTDAGLKKLATLKNLAKLNLSGTKVTGAGLKELAPLPKLHFLEMSLDQWTDEALKSLREIGRLQSIEYATTAKGQRASKPEDVAVLQLCRTKVTDAGLKELAPLKNLVTLNLFRTQVKDAGLKDLAELKQLNTLILLDTPVTDAGLKHLASQTNLTTIILLQTQVTKDGVAELRKALPKCKIVH